MHSERPIAADHAASNTSSERTALIVVDVQKAFDDPLLGERNNPAAEGNVARLLDSWRATGRPIFHIRHLNEESGRRFSSGQPGFEPKPEAIGLAGEPVITKTVNSSFIGTDLERRLRDDSTLTIVVCGLTTDHCVSTTARMAANLGFITTVVSDATATFGRVGPDGRHWSADEMHDSALASLHDEFAAIRTTDAVIRWATESNTVASNAEGAKR